MSSSPEVNSNEIERLQKDVEDVKNRFTPLNRFIPVEKDVALFKEKVVYGVAIVCILGIATMVINLMTQ